MDLKSFASAIEQIAEEKGISKEKVIETIEMAISAAYKKDYGRRGQIIKAHFNPETGEVKFLQVRIVVDESMLKPEEGEETEGEKEIKEEKPKEKMEEAPEAEKEGEGEEEQKLIRFNPEKHIMLEEAQKIQPDIKVEEELEEELETHEEYGRIAAQTAKQVIIQRIREAEREAIFSEYSQREGEVLSGIIQRIEGRTTFFDLGKAIGLMPPQEQVPGEDYRIGMRLRVYVLKVEETPKGPNIFLSRIHPKIISRLFELEVPEIAAGTVVIKSIAREPGSRSKIAVTSTEEGLDPIGSCVGQRGTRVATVINELGGEKIDIIAWNENPEKFIANAMAPAKVLDVQISDVRNQALVVVPEDQLSLAIGKEGQNVRLAAKLTGWKIDIKSQEQLKKEKEAEKERLKETKKAEKAAKKAEEKEKKGKPAKKARKTKIKKEE